MSLSKISIKSSLKTLIQTLNESNDPEQVDQAIDNFCDEMADFMIETIQSASVTCTIPAGTVSTGTSPAVVPLPAPLKISGSLS